MSGLGRLRELWREHPLVFMSAVLYRIPFHPIRIVYFRRLELQGPPQPSRRPPEPLTLRQAGEGDLDLLVRCFDKRETYQRRFASGEICLVAVEDGAVVGYEWFSTKGHLVEERYGYPFEIPGGALYSYDAFTSESHRDRGIWRRIMAEAGAVMTREGKERILAHVEYGNPGSYAAHLRVGFRPIERYLFVSILGLRLVRRTWVAPPSGRENRVH
jgi:GNAT superfamily N-acetyltransferase